MARGPACRMTQPPSSSQRQVYGPSKAASRSQVGGRGTLPSRARAALCRAADLLTCEAMCAHEAAAAIPHLAAASLMRPLTMPHGTSNGFFVHWISSSSALAS
jgi:hypothetical protein